MKKIFIFLLLTLLGLPLMAQDDSEQVLVFRNTGEVNLFFSSELDSVVCSHFDADSVWHEETVSQVFYGKDTTLVVPLAEVDSVCFGSRNETVFHPGVHQLDEQDIEWLIRYEDNCLYFRGDTPDGILPKTGEKLFAQQYKPKVPSGICAQVDAVTMANGEWVVTIHDVELSDIFERLFYAGKLKIDEPVSGPRRVPVLHRTFEGKVDIGDIGNVKMDLELDVDIEVVAQPLRGYYNLVADIRRDYTTSITAHVESDYTYEDEVRVATIPLGVYALVFTPELTINTFVDMNAELSANLTFGQSTTSHITYVKEFGKDAVFTNTNNGDASDNPFSQVDITCKGEIFMGGEAVLDFNILRELAGARLRLRGGPSFSAEFGLGLLNQARDYSPEVYGKAEFSCCGKVAVVGIVYTRNLFWGEENEHEVLSLENKFFERTLDLFPHFFESRAVQAPPTQQPQTEVTTATKTDSEMLKEVEVGFQLLDENENVKDSVFVGQVQPQQEEVVQGFKSEFKVDKEEVPQLMRPVIHYAGRTIPAATTNVLSNVQIQPAIFWGSNGAVTFVGSYPFRGEVTKDSTNYRAGAYLPIPVVDSVFVDKDSPSTITTLTYIDSSKESLLYGTWKGEEDGVAVTYVFNEDKTGSLNGRPFTFKLNYPQSGKIVITFDNDEHMTMSVVNLQESILQYRLDKSTTLYRLYKQ